MTDNHAHHPPRRPASGGDEPPAVDWFAALDVVIWVAVFVIAALGVEYLFGYMVREKLARQADRFLAKATADAAGGTDS